VLVTVGVQVAFASFFLSMRRRAKVAAARRSALALVEEKGAA
jgi:hypothetical protein